MTAYLVRGLLTAVAWFGAALLALSAVGLLEAFWFAFQVLQGTGASQVLTYARGYAVTFAVGAGPDLGRDRAGPPHGAAGRPGSAGHRARSHSLKPAGRPSSPPGRLAR